MVKWYKTYLEVYGKSFDEISDDSIRKVKRQLKERQNDSPLVSVVLIAHNEERHLISCIWSLSENHCHFPIEIIAVNNNSTDKTEEVLKSLGVTYYNETKKGPGYARQCGLDHAKGKYHICIDADTLYPPHYIETHVKYLMNPRLHVHSVYGVLWLTKDIPDSDYGATKACAIYTSAYKPSSVLNSVCEVWLSVLIRK